MVKKIIIGVLLCILSVTFSWAFPPVKNPNMSDANLPSKHEIEGVPIYRQGRRDCGPTSLSMMFNFYGKNTTKDEIAKWIMGPKSVKSEDMEDYAKRNKLNVYVFKGKDTKKIKYLLVQGYPLIVLGIIPNGWCRGSAPVGNGHYVVLVGYDEEAQQFIINEPGPGMKVEISYTTFKEFHSNNRTSSGWTLTEGPYYVLCVYP
jgi:ABC-type bacteriocin/lantibiotic exporter with double-glycine peptidase domain